jgi:predicted amidohydrolase
MRAAVVQLCSGADVERNLARAEHWIERAAGAGAELVALPENFALMREGDAGPLPLREPLVGRIGEFLREQARRHRVVLAGGSFPEAISGDRRAHNTSLVFDPDGSLRGVYRKIHLFDVALAEATHAESRHFRPGSDLVVAHTQAGPLGLSICYDVRFPELYRELVRQGARTLLVPSAFTVPTGRDHWEVLLRARAIENQCFVVAAAQCGAHGPTRRTFGRSLIADPWGTVMAMVPDGEGYAVAELDFDRQDEIRKKLPALEHRRLHPPGGGG